MSTKIPITVNDEQSGYYRIHGAMRSSWSIKCLARTTSGWFQLYVISTPLTLPANTCRHHPENVI